MLRCVSSHGKLKQRTVQLMSLKLFLAGLVNTNQQEMSPTQVGMAVLTIECLINARPFSLKRLIVCR